MVKRSLAVILVNFCKNLFLKFICITQFNEKFLNFGKDIRLHMLENIYPFLGNLIFAKASKTN